MKYFTCFYIGGMVAYFPTFWPYAVMGETPWDEVLYYLLTWPRVFLIFFS